MVRLIAFLLFAASACAEIIPAARLGSWQGNVGVPGGIIARTTVYTNFAAGSTDVNIQTGINNCPTNQVVLLGEGTFTISMIDPSMGKSGYTLRGTTNAQGDRLTRINCTGGQAAIYLREFAWIDEWTSASNIISSGFTKGSTSITLPSASGFSVGNLIWIEQDNDGTNQFGFGLGGGSGDSNPVCGRLRTGKALLGQIIMPTNISGNTIHFQPALNLDFSSAFNVRAINFPETGPKFVGIEDLIITHPTDYGVRIEAGYASWIKNCEITDWSTWGVQIHGSANIEVRECYFHTPAVFENSHGYSLQIDYGNNCLIENNAFYKFQDGVLLQSMCFNNAIAYNSFYRSYPEYNGINQMLASLWGNHTAYGALNLWEGNFGNSIHADFYYGPSATMTILRNYLTGSDPDVGQNRIAVNLDSRQWSNSVVGNIIGSAGTNAPLYCAMPDITVTNTNTTVVTWVRGRTNWNSFGYTEARLYRLGYPFIGNNGFTGQGNPPGTNVTEMNKHDSNVLATTIVHGNYEFPGGVVWDGGIADQNIPQSYLYSEKPAWFGHLTWPPYGPAVAFVGQPTTPAGITNIPAGHYFVRGEWPAAAQGGGGTAHGSKKRGGHGSSGGRRR